jgi:hypothetical protein
MLTTLGRACCELFALFARALLHRLQHGPRRTLPTASSTYGTWVTSEHRFLESQASGTAKYKESVSMRTQSLSAQVLMVVAASGVMSLSTGCSDNDVVRTEGANIPSTDTGRLQLALTARSDSGALYRLRQASFQVLNQDPFGGFGTFLSTENDPLASTLEATLQTGDYTVDLFGGWFLEKVIDGVATPVAANLLSSPTQFVSIAANQESLVSYRFETNGEVIDFGTGRLIIEIEVTERSAGSNLGEPLQLLNGFISRESNLHGIEAQLFVATSPLNANIQVTSDTGALCVQGDVGVVQDGDFTTQWGALVGLVFTSGGTEAAPWDLDGGNVTGFAFTLTGPAVPAPLRLGALPGGADPNVDNFCQQLAATPGATLQVPFSGITRDCWLIGNEQMLASSLQNINWTIPADEMVPHVFDFCVSDLRPILR